MPLRPWDALRDLVVLREQLDRPGSPTGWTPPVDLYEMRDCYVVAVELPGLSRDDVELRMHDGRLTIRGERPESCVPPQRYVQLERGQGSFVRSFAFPLPVDIDRVTADFQDGVLTITVPKIAPPEPRRVEVA